MGPHLELRNKQRLVVVEKASTRHRSIFTREKSPAAIRSGEHQSFVLLDAASGAWSCPTAPGSSPGCSRLGAAASSPSRHPTRYRSRQRILDNVPADAPLVQTSRQAGKSRKGLFFFLFFFFLLHSFLLFRKSGSIRNARSGLQPPRPPPAPPLLCSVRNADPLDIVISVNICRCSRAGNACRIGCFFARVPLAVEEAADDPDGSRRLRQVFCRDDMWAPINRTNPPTFFFFPLKNVYLAVIN